MVSLLVFISRDQINLFHKERATHDNCASVNLTLHTYSAVKNRMSLRLTLFLWMNASVSGKRLKFNMH